MFRCAESMVARGQRGEAIALYEHLCGGRGQQQAMARGAIAVANRAMRPNSADVPAHVREAAEKKIRALRQESGPTL
jgi:hypothetical protein